jgi:hypothetical protein
MINERKLQVESAFSVIEEVCLPFMVNTPFFVFPEEKGELT